MDTMGIRTKFNHIWRFTTYTVLFRVLICIYILVPIVLRLFPSIFLHTVFSFKYKGPAVYTRLSNPDKDWNFVGATNQYLLSQSGNSIGLWHLPPEEKGQEDLSKADKVIIYCHGKAGNRASGHRTPFYRVLVKMGFHIVTFDYSGFGDSTGIPNGDVVKLDMMSVYRWTVEQLQKPDAIVIVWGHSLGSGIASYSLAQFSDVLDIKPPHGVIVEAPFTNLYEASKSNSMFRLCNTLYPFIWTKLFKISAKNHKMEFFTEKNLQQLKSSILILHSEDDPKISVEMSEKLYDTLISRPVLPGRGVRFYRFLSSHGLGHNLIYTYQNLDEILNDFLKMLKSPSKISQKMLE